MNDCLITLPWPSSKLSPNVRLHWAALAAAKKAYRRECCFATLEQRAYGAGELIRNTDALRLEVTFYRPQNRNFDRDNLLARMKSGIDGLCDAFEIDDKRFVSVTVRVADEIVQDGKVVLKIQQETHG